MKEMWADIEETDGLYQVSNTGKIRSTPNVHKGHKFVGEYHELTPNKDRYGYLQVNYYNSQGKHVVRKVHKLVALAFIPNLCNLPQVSHKDENKENNNATNLEWCTHSYNNNYGSRNHRISLKLMGRKPQNNIPIVQYDNKGCFVTCYDSIDDARKTLGLSTRSHVSECCAHKRKSAHGYLWFYKHEIKDIYGAIPELIKVQK
jgi:hypothetical protein